MVFKPIDQLFDLLVTIKDEESLSTCLFCSGQGQLTNFVSDSIYSDWSLHCAESLIEIFRLDSTFCSILQNGPYCLECVSDLREINFLNRTIKVMQIRAKHYEQKLISTIKNKYEPFNDKKFLDKHLELGLDNLLPTTSDLDALSYKTNSTDNLPLELYQEQETCAPKTRSRNSRTRSCHSNYTPLVSHGDDSTGLSLDSVLDGPLCSTQSSYSPTSMEFEEDENPSNSESGSWRLSPCKKALKRRLVSRKKRVEVKDTLIQFQVLPILATTTVTLQTQPNGNESDNLLVADQQVSSLGLIQETAMQKSGRSLKRKNIKTDAAIPRKVQRQNQSRSRNLTKDELTRIFGYLKETLQNNLEIGKPTANKYYSQLIHDLKLPNVKTKRVKCRIAFLKSTYIQAINWRATAGSIDDSSDKILKLCPFFYELDQIFGRSKNPNGSEDATGPNLFLEPEYLHKTHERTTLGSHRLPLPLVPLRGSFPPIHCSFEGCIYSHTSQKMVDEHARRVHEGDTHPCHCEFCPQRFENAKGYKQHKKEFHQGKRSTCNHCGFVFDFETSTPSLNSHLELHRIREQGKEKFACVLPNCVKICNSSVELKKHVLNNHEILGTHRCKYCPTVFRHKCGLNDHIKKFHFGKLNPLKCNTCRYVAVSREDFKSHFETAHVKPEFVCEECGYSSRWRTSFRTHCLKHAPVETWPLKCSFTGCEKRFVRNKDLQEHEESHSGTRSYTCKICGRSYIRIKALRRHIDDKHGRLTYKESEGQPIDTMTK